MRLGERTNRGQSIKRTFKFGSNTTHPRSIEQRYFISEKSYKGKEIKALEHPGLWNGAMHHWNTIFVEVPLSTFNPVKKVNDLLRACRRSVVGVMSVVGEMSEVGSLAEVAAGRE